MMTVSGTQCNFLQRAIVRRDGEINIPSPSFLPPGAPRVQPGRLPERRVGGAAGAGRGLQGAHRAGVPAPLQGVLRRRVRKGHRMGEDAAR